MNALRSFNPFGRCVRVASKAIRGITARSVNRQCSPSKLGSSPLAHHSTLQSAFITHPRWRPSYPSLRGCPPRHRPTGKAGAAAPCAPPQKQELDSEKDETYDFLFPQLPNHAEATEQKEKLLSWPECWEKLLDRLAVYHGVGVCILAGGDAHAANPLARFMNAAAIPIGGNHRLIDVALGNLFLAGFTRVHVLTQFNSHLLNKYLNSAYPYDKLQAYRKPAFVQVLACHQTCDSKEWAKGSADAMRNAMPHARLSVQGHPPSSEMLVVSGQDLHDVNFRRAVAFHRATKADVTIVTQKHAFQGAHEMGVCQVDPHSRRIEQFVERPSMSQMRRMVSANGELDVSLGMYVFKTSVLERLLEENRGTEMAHMGADVLPYAVGMGMQVVSFDHEGSFRKCSDLRTYMEAQMDFVSAPELPPEFAFMNAVRGKSTATAMPPACCTGTDLVDSAVSEGAQLLGGMYNKAVIGQRAFIGENACICESVVYGLSELQNKETYSRELLERGYGRGIGRNVTLSNVVVSSDVSIGDDVCITNEARARFLDRSEEGIVIKDGVVVILQGAVIPDGFTL